MAKNFNIDLNILKSDFTDLINRANELKVTPLNLNSVQWEVGDMDEEEATISFNGPKKALVELAFFTHELYGDGFSFSDEDVLDCIY